MIRIMGCKNTPNLSEHRCLGERNVPATPKERRKKLIVFSTVPQGGGKNRSNNDSRPGKMNPQEVNTPAVGCVCVLCVEGKKKHEKGWGRGWESERESESEK